MGQQEVYEALKSNPKEWFTIDKLHNILGIQHQAISKSLSKIYKSDAAILKRYSVRRKGATSTEFRFAKEFDL
jgi:predicted transcriptional regulator